MNRVDLACAALALLALVGGYRLGLVRRLAAWAGVLGGVLLAMSLVPRLVGRVDPDADFATEGPRRLLAAAFVVGVGALLGQLVGSLIGARIKEAVTERNLGRPDSVLGAVIGLAGLVGALWVSLPTMAQVPGWPAREVRGSAVAGWLNRGLGPPPGILDNLGRSVGISGLPKVFEDLRETPEVAPPPEGLIVSPELLERGRASTLKVIGAACGQIQTGSGWVVEPGRVVTNAHVVAGTESLRIEDAGGTKFAAEVVAFDPRHDLALVVAPSLRADPLPTGDSEHGDVGVVLGYPGGGPFTASNFVVGRRISAIGRDIYNRTSIKRDIYEIGADLHPGNSGGPMLDSDGHVSGVVFAIAPDRGTVAYAITNDQVRELLAEAGDGPVATGPCTL